jgi:hypothetical protein
VGLAPTGKRRLVTAHASFRLHAPQHRTMTISIVFTTFNDRQ